MPQHYQGYAPAQYAKEISTVGSASATGSVGEKTQTTSGWAEQSMDYDGDDKMSEDQDQDHDQQHDDDGEMGDGVSSIGGFSDDVDKASLVGFGEGAGSTISGPVSTANARMLAARNSYNATNPNMTPRTQTQNVSGATGSGGSTPMSGIERPTSGNAGDARMDGVSYDQGGIDGGSSELMTPYAGGQRFSGAGIEVAENVMQDRLDDRGPRTMTSPPDQASLGRFGFERE